MKKFLFALMIAVTALSVALPEAQARRLGGGGSFGKQSQNVSRQAPMQSSQANTAATSAKPAPAAATGANAAAAKPPSPWKGMLGGALLGLGLGALFSSLGLGGAMGGMLSSMLMIGLLAMAALFVFRIIQNRKNGNQAQPAFANAYSYAGGQPAASTPVIGSRLEPQAQPNALQSLPLASGSAASSPAPWGIPADFDVTGFLRHSKTYYIRLQAAWDKADINDIREFTTPEMFGELRLQLQERGATANVTDVVTLDAELLGIETVGSDYLASVKFSGMVREDQPLSSTQAPAPFAEVWNLSKPTSGQGGWILAGIQSLS